MTLKLKFPLILVAMYAGISGGASGKEDFPGGSDGKASAGEMQET